MESGPGPPKPQKSHRGGYNRRYQRKFKNSRGGNNNARSTPEMTATENQNLGSQENARLNANAPIFQPKEDRNTVNNRSRGQRNRGNYRGGYNPGHQGHYHYNAHFNENYDQQYQYDRNFGQSHHLNENYTTGQHYNQSQPIDENQAPSLIPSRSQNSKNKQIGNNQENGPSSQSGRKNERNRNRIQNEANNSSSSKNGNIRETTENTRENLGKQNFGKRYENRQNKKNSQNDENSGSSRNVSKKFNKGTSKSLRIQKENQNERSKTPNEEEKFAELAMGVSKLISNRSKAKSVEDQRDILGKKLKKGQLECSICLEKMKYYHKIWHCSNCYNLLHLKCAKEWAQSQSKEEGWRCPYCQNLATYVPSRYYCYCGAEENPQQSQLGEMPHSCQKPCGRKRSCIHKCPLLCHPGACPPCTATVLVSCNCGRTQARVKCGMELECKRICDKLLACGNCRCTLTCHKGECEPCVKKQMLNCKCGKVEKEVPCGSTEPWSCLQKCKRLKDCGKHECEELCHAGPCKPCSLKPPLVNRCPCGKMTFDWSTRKSCTDPVPNCDKICDKERICGHRCREACHGGECSKCDILLSVDCSCGRESNVKVQCHLYIENPLNAKCNRPCKKKMSCGRHTCPVICCPDRKLPAGSDNHICTRVCGRKLSCGQHNCEDICHRGNCRRCPNVSFDELRCHCGAAVIYPPIQCGTVPPECLEKCSRAHACGHEVHHNCHSDAECPPCPVLMEKRCNCGKIIRTSIPCFQKNVSCGKECRKELECGHLCRKICHIGVCQEEGTKCTQPCEEIRPICGHPCGLPCHKGTKCEPSYCETKIIIKCSCERRRERISCDKHQSMLKHQTRARQKQGLSLEGLIVALECDAECDIQARNRRIAEALDIEQPELSSVPAVVYPESVALFAQNRPQMAMMVETNLRRLATQVEEGCDKKLDYNLPPMNKKERLFVHELSDFYNITSQGRDIEPNRFIMLTAYKGKCTIPPNSLAKMLKKSGVKISLNSATYRPTQLPSRRNLF